MRIYAERGLLPPHSVDPINGYRYYAPEQVPTGWLISLLRSADLSLDQIGRIIGTDPESGLRQLEQARSQSSGAARRSKPCFIGHGFTYSRR
ncbi:MAG TPA: MerR family transcriptional regulator [Propionibacteriaceae bacterium]|nr:MerR family transcriptional regulator [Propionibacteriaceae bacterium]